MASLRDYVNFSGGYGVSYVLGPLLEDVSLARFGFKEIIMAYFFPEKFLRSDSKPPLHVHFV